MKLEEMVGKMMTEAQFDEAAGEKDACYTKVKARYDVWPSAYASGALVKCRKVGAANWGNSKKEGLDDLKALPKDLKKSINKKRNEGLADKISKNLSKYNKRAQKSKDTMKKYAKAKKKESVDEAAMELNKIKDAILMFQKKIKKGDAVRGSVVIARDEEHLKNLIKVYKKMGGKGIKESVDESKTSNMMRDIRKGGTAGPWDIIISKNNKVVTQVSVKNLKEIPAYLASLRARYPNHKIGIEAKSGKIVYNENDKGKVLKLLIKKGDNPKDAKKDVQKLYNKVSKMYKNASPSKKAEIISALSAKMESVEEGFGGELKGEDKKKFENDRKKNGEQLGYTLTGTSDVKDSLKKIVKEEVSKIMNEAIEPQGIMAKINKIVQDKQAMKISGVLMDMFSASIMMRIYNSVNDKSKEQMNKGTMRQVQVILHKVMKQNKVTK